MREFQAIASYISENYGSASKIVEVGIGKVSVVAAELRRLLPGCDLVVTDVEELPGLPAGAKFVCDDITAPDLSVYEGADLIYAIRPPPELQPHLLRVAHEVGADLLLKLTSDEEAAGGWKLVNYQGVTLHLFGPKSMPETSLLPPATRF
jgi:uncharacterized UPF0146 family protein